jgi:PAS domain S-box-containing protein
MSNFLDWLLPTNFMPHGHCYLWRTDVLWLHVGSDALIAASYYAIPVALVYFVRQRRSVLPYWWVAGLFATFIFLCGTTHLMNIWTVWHPDYVVDGLIKLATGLVSAATAVLVFTALPQALALRTPIELQAEVGARTGELVAANLRLRDEIAARERTEAALRASEIRFRATFENAAVGIAHVAPDGRWLMVNEVLCRITGYAHPELLTRTFADITHPSDIEKDWEQARRLLAGEIDAYSMEKRYIRRDGSSIWAVLTASLVRNADGSPAYFISIVDDISQRKRIESELQEKQYRTQLAFEASRAATWVVDFTRGSLEQFDERARELAGLNENRSEWPAGTFCSLLTPQDREKMLAAQAATRAAPGPGPTVEYRIVRTDGEPRWLQGTGIIERDHEGQPCRFIGVSIDITERKQLETQLRLSVDQLGEANSRKDHFLATLAHELRNPLAPIANGVQIIKRSPSPQTLERTIEMMERQIAHVVRLVDDLIDVSRVTHGKARLRREPLALAPLVSDALESSWTAAESSRLQSILDAPERPVLVAGDRDRLTQVFSNILANAAKYTRGEGKVWVSVTAEGSHAVVRIRDTGIGIPPEELESIFEMFSQLREPGYGESGLGIGLALVHQLVALHGGSVEARSEGAGRGSEFIVRLPLLADDTAQVAPSEPQVPSAVVGRPRRILVVDDNADCAESLAALLRLMGHEVREAADGVAAIDAAQAFQPHIIFMDIGLPRMSGLEATQRIHALRLPVTPLVVALTGWGQEIDRERSRRAGAAYHLTKPIDQQALQSVLRFAEQAVPGAKPRATSWQPLS